jgi:hypothetical protein
MYDSLSYALLIVYRFGGSMPLLLVYFSWFCTFIRSQSYNTVHSSIIIHRGPSPSPHRLWAQWENLTEVPRFELGPALALLRKVKLHP